MRLLKTWNPGRRLFSLSFIFQHTENLSPDTPLCYLEREYCQNIYVVLKRDFTTKGAETSAVALLHAYSEYLNW